jgi:hypothetical protein
MNYWILQSNPKYFRILDWLQNFNWLNDDNLTDCWHISRYGLDVKPEDVTFIWKSKGNTNVRGIYAKSLIVPTPKKFPLMDKEREYFKGEAGKVEQERLANPNMATIAIQYKKLYLHNPLLADDIEAIWKTHGFKKLNIIASPQKGIYRLDSKQGKIIESTLNNLE